MAERKWRVKGSPSSSEAVRGDTLGYEPGWGALDDDHVAASDAAAQSQRKITHKLQKTARDKELGLMGERRAGDRRGDVVGDPDKQMRNTFRRTDDISMLEDALRPPGEFDARNDAINASIDLRLADHDAEAARRGLSRAQHADDVLGNPITAESTPLRTDSRVPRGGPEPFEGEETFGRQEMSSSDARMLRGMKNEVTAELSKSRFNKLSQLAIKGGKLGGRTLGVLGTMADMKSHWDAANVVGQDINKDAPWADRFAAYAERVMGLEPGTSSRQALPSEVRAANSL